MDKNEYNVKLEEINRYVDQGNYAEAARVCDQIDWKRVRNIRTLCLVSEIYEAEHRYEDSKTMLLRAYKKSPVGRAIVYRLVEVSIKMGQFDEAIEYYSEYVRLAPNDSNRFILKYMIYRGRGSSVDEQIEILKEYLNEEYNEKYAYELAKLYQEADRISECLNTCDDLVLWFHSGPYVTKALELKKRYAPLTPKQQEIYDNRFNEQEEEEIGQEKQMVETEDTSLAETIVEDTTREIASEVARAAGASDEDGADVNASVTGVNDAGIERMAAGTSSANVSGINESMPDADAAGFNADRMGTDAAEADRVGYGNAAGSGVGNSAEAEIDFASRSETNGQDMGGTIDDIVHAARAEAARGEDTDTDADEEAASLAVSDAADSIQVPKPSIEDKYNTKDFQEEMLRSMREVVSGVGIRGLTDEDEEAMDAVIDQSKQEQAERIESDAARIRMTRKLTLPELQRRADAGQLSIDDVLLSMGEKGAAVRETVNDAAAASGARPQRAGVLSAVDEALLNMGVRGQEQKAAEAAESAQSEETGGEAAVYEENEAAASEAPASEMAASEGEIQTVAAGEAAADIAVDTAGDTDVNTDVNTDTDSLEKTDDREASASANLAEAIKETVARESAVAEAGEAPEREMTAEDLADTDAGAGESDAAVDENGSETEAETEDDAQGFENLAKAVEEVVSEESELDDLAAAIEKNAEAIGDEADDDIKIAGAIAHTPAADVDAAISEAIAGADGVVGESGAGAAVAASPEADIRKAGDASDMSIKEVMTARTRVVPTGEIAALHGQNVDDIREAGAAGADADDGQEIKAAGEDAAGSAVQAEGEAGETAGSGTGEDAAAAEGAGAENANAAGGAARRPQRQARLWIKPELRGFFDGYLNIRDMDRQIAGAIEQILAKGEDKTSRTGNVLIFGGHGCGKTTIGTAIAKAIAQERGQGYVKMARIYAADLNRKDIASTIAKIAGGVLIVEEAGDLDDMVADQLSTALEFRTDGLILILEDEQRYIHDLLMRHPRLTMKFTSQIYIPAFTAEDLVGFAALYADDKDYALSEEAASLLRDRLESHIENSDNGVSITNVLDITDEAIARANKFSRKLFSGKKRYDGEGRVILQERDFR